MKYPTIISLLLLPLLAPALGAVVPNSDDSLVDLQKRNIKDGIKNILGHVEEAKVNALEVAGKWAKVAGNGVKVAGSEGVKAAEKGVQAVGKEFQKLENTFAWEPEQEGLWDELRDVLPACAKSDCKNNIIMNEALRWVTGALKAVGVAVHENPFAIAAILIGVSFLLIELITGGMLIPIALRVIGFGVKGPIKNTIAAAVQRVINPFKLGSVFAQLQSAAMKGPVLKEIQNFAYVAIAGLVGVGVGELIEAGDKPHNHTTHRQEWRNWISESRIDTLSDVTSHAAQLWGNPVYGGCFAYGYQEVRAPLVLIPEDMGPLAACKRTPALINGIGFKTPLGCVDEGPEKGVIGLWYVPSSASQCMPNWGKFEDEGCLLYGRRRRFARLMGLKNNGDWKGVCESTPAIIDDKHYDQPSHCDDKGVAGIYGVFDIVDEQCECSCHHT